MSNRSRLLNRINPEMDIPRTRIPGDLALQNAEILIREYMDADNLFSHGLMQVRGYENAILLLMRDNPHDINTLPITSEEFYLYVQRYLNNELEVYVQDYRITQIPNPTQGVLAIHLIEILSIHED